MEDHYPVGTVIRWVSSGAYTYAAVKTEYNWYTTSASRGGVVQSSVGQILGWEGLWMVLCREETSQVEVASVWDPLFSTDDLI